MKHKYFHLIMCLGITLFLLVGMIILNTSATFENKNMKTIVNNCLGLGTIIQFIYALLNFTKEMKKDE